MTCQCTSATGEQVIQTHDLDSNTDELGLGRIARRGGLVGGVHRAVVLQSAPPPL
jgi:hypothetical protein